MGKLVHLGAGRSPKAFTVSYANAYRPAKLFEDFFWTAADRFQRTGTLGQHKPFRLKNKLLSLDSTPLSLCLTGQLSSEPRKHTKIPRRP